MDRTDEELVLDYLAGREEAFSLLVERHLKTVYSFVVRFVGDPGEAEDIVQDTFLKAWKHIPTYRQESSKFKTWILRIARNTAIDYLRKRKHIPFSEFETDEGQNIFAETVPDTQELQDELFARQQDRDALEKAIHTLPLDAREVVLLHYTNGLTFIEIGELLGEPQNTVKSRHFRAMQSLRRILAGTKGDELHV